MTAQTARFTAAQALVRASNESARPSQDWYQLCLQFVRTMAGIPAAAPDAITAWNRAKIRHTNGAAPAGAAVFYSGGKHGHVVISAGNGSGWSNDVRRRGKIDKIALTEPVTKWGFDLLGWTEDLNGFKLKLTLPPKLSLSEVKWAATHANLIPGSESRISLIRASLRTVGCGDDRTDNFRDMWRRWQGKCGYRGADADGIPGASSVAALASRCGYVVTP